MRGVYSVGGFSAAPRSNRGWALSTGSPHSRRLAQAARRIQTTRVQLLQAQAAHDPRAMPGHYVQMEMANDVQPESGDCCDPSSATALTSKVGASMLPRPCSTKASWTAHQKWRLPSPRRNCGDSQRHSGRPPAHAQHDRSGSPRPDGEADVQEEEEATAKLQRAKLSSCQLPMYLSAGATGCAFATNTSGSTHRPACPHSTIGRQGRAVPLPALTSLLTP